MRNFAELLDRLSYQPQRNAKLRLLTDYFSRTPDPDRGWGLAALTGELAFPHAKPGIIRMLVAERCDPVLFELSYDYVGDLAETVALLWPDVEAAESAPSLDAVVTALTTAGRAELPALIAGWLDSLDATGRWALLKLITGGLRVGVSARLAKTALAALGGKEPAEVEEIWHALKPPYGELFAWLGGAEAPTTAGRAAFLPVMLAHAITESELSELDPADFLAEWKWDGVRIQIVGEAGRTRLYARSGDEMTAAFPDVVVGLDGLDARLDGELLVRRGAAIGSFSDLQTRLNRKTANASLIRSTPVFVRLYDLLRETDTDLRGLPFEDRRRRLEAWHARLGMPVFDISPLVPFSSWDELTKRRHENRSIGVEGVMLKRKNSHYVSGRPKGLWFKWKRDPHLVDAVLMYAQRGHGKRSSFYSDYTFGVWRGEELVPVGKAYFGFTDAELSELDRWVRNHTVNRFGPVREVQRGLVLEVAFEGLQRSTRHKSGLAMRFPRISRIRWDKPYREADRIENLEKILESA